MGSHTERRRVTGPESLLPGLQTTFNDIADQVGTPVYVYSQPVLEQNASKFLAIQAPFGKQISFAVKAWTNASGLRIFNKMGLHFDASKQNEAIRAMDPKFGN